MRIEALVRALLESEGQLCAERLVNEASVHLPRKGTRWIASYRDHTGQQRWRSTGLTDKRAAIILAQEWELAERKRRAEHSEPMPSKRRYTGSRWAVQFTQREVARLLGISQRAVRDIEARALRKLRRHPSIAALWREWGAGHVEEAAATGPVDGCYGQGRVAYA